MFKQIDFTWQGVCTLITHRDFTTKLNVVRTPVTSRLRLVACLLPRYDVICALSEYTRTVKRNPFVK